MSATSFSSPVRLQVFTKDHGPLTKSVSWVSGQLVKDGGQCKMSTGSVETVAVTSMGALNDLLCGLTTSQAISLSTSNHYDFLGGFPQRVVAKPLAAQYPDAITRSAEHFKFEEGEQALVLFDRDSSDGELMSVARAMGILGELMPGFDSLAAASTHSSSSFIYTDGGEELAGEGNHHTFVVAKDGADIPRFAKALEGQLWLKGFGRPFVTRSGSFIARTVFDMGVFSPERLVFEAGAKLGTGLVQRRPAPWFREGAALDTTLVQDLTEDQQLEVARLKAQCRDSAAPEVARVRAVYEAQEREKLVAKGKTAEQAEEIVSERLSMTLNDEDELYFDHLKGMGITVGEARAQRAEFIDRTMADPLEPDYTGAAGSVIGGKAKLLARPTGELFIKSFAHGGCTYRLLGEVVDDFDTVQDELAATMVDRTDSGNVALLADLTQGNLRYVPETKTWLFWSGQRWEPDRYGVKAQFAALQVGQHYLDQAAELLGQMPPGLEARERRHIEQAAGLVKKWAEACRNKRGLDAMLGLAKVDYRFALPVNVLDRDPWLFGVDNGVVDLRTGALREASRDEYVTRRSPFAFNPNAPATRWLKFIDEITATPEPGGMHRVRPKLASYLQQALGYCMTGSTREHKMFIAIGEGSNGKSVLLDLLKEIMGEYGESISPEALMVSKHDADAERATPIARKLAGARTATSSESKDGQRLDVALVKRHTGGGFLTARGLHENSFTFEITHKLWLMTNHKPALDHMDEAMRGRLHMIPFDMKWNRPGHPERNPNFPDGDKTLIDQLRTEAEGALAWLVAGAVAYQRDGLEPPVEVSGMTKTYFADQDPFGLWFATCEQCDPKDGLRATDLLEAYRSWCDEEDFGDHAAGTSKAFSNKLKARGVVSVKTKEGRRYGLRPNDAEMSEVAP